MGTTGLNDFKQISLLQDLSGLFNAIKNLEISGRAHKAHFPP